MRRADILRRLKQSFHLEADHRRHSVGEPHAATELVRQTERVVVFRERAEQADFIPAIVLCRERVCRQRQQHKYRGELSHDWPPPQLVCRSSTRRFNARPAGVVLGATGCVGP